ncbi:MAG: hypothetical protein WAL80_24585 [Xanthobacteraceae bacterium]|jgi:hypothetical protein
MIYDVSRGLSAVKRSRIHASLVLRQKKVATPPWRIVKNKSIPIQVLRWIFAAALAACTVILSTSAGNAQAFSPDLTRSRPEPSSATYDCYPFFPHSDQYLSTISALERYLERYGSGASYWQSIISEDDFLNRLEEARKQVAITPIARGQFVPLSLQWPIVLYTNCQMLNASIKMRPSESYRYLEWLETQYEERISKPASPTNAVVPPNGTCVMDAPLPITVIRMWLAWNIFNNRLYERAEILAQRVEDATSSFAQQLEAKLGRVPMPQHGPNYEKEKCEVLQHGPLNDAAAAAWVEAMSFYCTGRDSKAGVVLTRLRSLYHEGRVYDPAGDQFWPPAETAEGCP